LPLLETLEEIEEFPSRNTHLHHYYINYKCNNKMEESTTTTTTTITKTLINNGIDPSEANELSLVLANINNNISLQDLKQHLINVQGINNVKLRAIHHALQEYQSIQQQQQQQQQPPQSLLYSKKSTFAPFSLTTKPSRIFQQQNFDVFIGDATDRYFFALMEDGSILVLDGIELSIIQHVGEGPERPPGTENEHGYFLLRDNLQASPMAIAIHPSFDFFAQGSGDEGSIIIRNAKTSPFEIVFTMKCHEQDEVGDAICFNAKGDLLASRATVPDALSGSLVICSFKSSSSSSSSSVSTCTCEILYKMEIKTFFGMNMCFGEPTNTDTTITTTTTTTAGSQSPLLIGTEGVIIVVDAKLKKITNTLRHHKGRVTHMIPYGSQIISSGEDSVVNIFNLNGHIEQQLKDPHGPKIKVMCLAAHAGVGLLATGALNNTIRIWNVSHNNLQLVTAMDRLHDVNFLSFHPGNGMTLYSSGKSIFLWKAEGVEAMDNISEWVPDKITGPFDENWNGFEDQQQQQQQQQQEGETRRIWRYYLRLRRRNRNDITNNNNVETQGCCVVM
jgi:WD40 repeat protein